MVARDKRISNIARRFNESRADWLLSQVFVHDPVLNALHHSLAKKSHNRCVDSGRHDAEGIPGRDEAVMWLQILESTFDDANVPHPVKPLTKCQRHGVIGMNEPNVLEHKTSPTGREVADLGITQPRPLVHLLDVEHLPHHGQMSLKIPLFHEKRNDLGNRGDRDLRHNDLAKLPGADEHHRPEHDGSSVIPSDPRHC